MASKKKFYNKLSFKVSVGCAICILVVLSLFSVRDYYISKKQLLKGFERAVDVNAKNLTGILSSAIWNYEVETAQQALQSIFNAVEGVKAIGVFEGENYFFAYSMETGELIEAPDKTKEEYDTFFKIFSPDNEEEVVGSLALKVSSSHIDKKLQNKLIDSIYTKLATTFLLVIVISLLLRFLVIRPVLNVTAALEDMHDGNGDLTKRIEYQSADEIGDMTRLFNLFVGRINETVKSVANNIVDNHDFSKKIADYTESIQGSISKQNIDVEAIVSSITQLNASAKSISETASSTSDEATITLSDIENSSKASAEFSNESKQLAGKLQHSVERANIMQGNVKDINEILITIRSIADQTNLLALNAAIESARAGEMGRGFAVVADEVRALAARTQASTLEIESMMAALNEASYELVNTIESTQKVAESLSGNATNTSEQLLKSHTMVKALSGHNQHIAIAASEQNDASLNISDAIHNIASNTQFIEESVCEASKASANLKDKGATLKSLINRFKYES